jgi:PAS domain S-box-containing protein
VAARSREIIADRDGAASEAILRFAVESSTEGMVVLDESLRVIDANPAIALMIGIPLDRFIGMRALDPRWRLIREDGTPVQEMERPSVNALLKGEAKRGMVVGIRKPLDEGVLWVEVGAVPLPSGSGGKPSRILVYFNDITEKKAARDRLSRKIGILNAINDYSMRLEEASLADIYALIVGMGRSVFEASAAAIARYDGERKALILQEIAWSDETEHAVLKFISDRVVKGLAAPLGDVEYGKMMEMKIGLASNLHELSFGNVPRAISDAIERRLGMGWFRGLALVSHGELFGGLSLAGKKGSEAPGTEELRVFAEIAANAIKRKQAEERIAKLLEEKEVILHEVHHRIKNNMSTMISLLSVQSRLEESAEVREALTDAIARLQSMGTLYDKLFRAEDLREMSLRDYLPALAREIIDMFPNGDIVSVEERVDDIRIGIKKLSVLGILVNEIVTNSMKYAFDGKESGRIALSAKLKRDRVSIRIEDDGVGMPAGIDLDSSKGFGLSLIRMLSRQMDASVAVSRGRGTAFDIEFDR